LFQIKAVNNDRSMVIRASTEWRGRCSGMCERPGPDPCSGPRSICRKDCRERLIHLPRMQHRQEPYWRHPHRWGYEIRTFRCPECKSTLRLVVRGEPAPARNAGTSSTVTCTSALLPSVPVFRTMSTNGVGAAISIPGRVSARMHDTATKMPTAWPIAMFLQRCHQYCQRHPTRLRRAHDH
jgi:hypothetical protein